MKIQQKIFGTDGIRGMANVYPMTVEMAMAIGQGIANVVKNNTSRQKIIIGKDTRLSGYMLENALVAGICSMGVDVLLVGPLPTPAIAFLTRKMHADAGIVISASHNPYQDNGIKIFGKNGFKLADNIEVMVEEYIFNLKQAASLTQRPAAEAIGKAKRMNEALEYYINFLKSCFPDKYALNRFLVAVDCANGATYKVAPIILNEFGINFKLIGAEPNGTNINKDVGSLYPEYLQKIIKEGEANIGLAFDGDGDRLIMVDEKGELVDGDQIIAICADDMITRGSLKQSSVVATIMSNLGLELYLHNRGINLIRTQVGDRYVVEAMVQGGYNLGGEQSGHLVFLDYNTTGDGILSALQVLKIISSTGKSLAELKKVMSKIPQTLINLKIKNRLPLREMPGIANAIHEQKERLGKRGRILVRYSGTEPLLRIMVEAENAALMNEVAAILNEAAFKELTYKHNCL